MDFGTSGAEEEVEEEEREGVDEFLDRKNSILEDVRVCGLGLL